MPLLVIFLAFVGFGITAIVVDAGSLYAEKKVMVTAADAGALAGAEVLEKAGASNYDAKKALAEETARNIAMANGAASSPAIFIGYDPTYHRKVIRVTCNVTKDTFFAKLMHGNEGDETASIRADAVATWGYIKKYTAKNLIPIFVFDNTYNDDEAMQCMLHSQFPSSPPNYGFFDVGINMYDALKGESSTSVIGTVLDNVTGNREAIVNSVTTRLENAEDRFTGDPEAKKEFMTGLVPVIRSHTTAEGPGFFEINGIPTENQNDSSKWPSNLQLPVDYFAYYVIEDIIKQNQTSGVKESLYTSDYDHPAGTGVDYTAAGNTITLPDGEIIKRYVLTDKINEALIIGRFTGKTEPRVSVEDGDQEDPDPNVDGEATYSKLIE